MQLFRCSFVLALLVSCGPKPAPKASGPTCETIPPKLTEALVEEQKSHGADEAVLAEARVDGKKVEPYIAKACVDDKWSAELIRCIDAMPPLQVGPSCQTMMSAEQLDALQRIRAGFATSSSSGGPPPP